MKTLALIASLFIGSYAYGISVNPASNVTADSANTAQTIIYRDASGDFAAGTATVTTLAATGVTATTVAVSSSATANFPATYRGAFTSTQLSTLSANPGDIALNITTTQIVISSATTEALNGAWISISTSPAYTKLAGY